ncbi:MAG: DUF4331 family protein [Candidatus Eisenbacteria bacterium]
MNYMTRVAGLLMLAAVPLCGCSDDPANVLLPGAAFDQVDRMAIPALNTALIPAAKKEEFNRASPSGDVATYRTDVVNSITALRANVATRGMGPETGGVTPDQLANIIIPDVVTIDFAQPVVFPNGRGPNDDVIDGVLSLVLNRTVGDAVGPDNTILGTFPYLGVPNLLPSPQQ